MRSVVGSSRTLVPDPLPFWIIHVAAPLSPLVRASKQAGSDNDTNSNTNENHSNAQNVSNNDDNSIDTNSNNNNIIHNNNNSDNANP